MKWCDLCHVPVPMFVFHCEIETSLVRMLHAITLRGTLSVSESVMLHLLSKLQLYTMPGFVSTRFEQIVAFAFNSTALRINLAPKPTGCSISAD